MRKCGPLKLGRAGVNLNPPTRCSRPIPNRNEPMKYLIVGLGIVALVGVVAVLVSVPVWLLWNWLMPSIFGLKTISWMQALGLSVLCGLLFKSSASSSGK